MARPSLDEIFSEKPSLDEIFGNVPVNKPSVDFATQGRRKPANDSLYPAGMQDVTTQDIQNEAAAPHRPTPTRIVAAEQAAPDLVSAFENIKQTPKQVVTTGRNPLGSATAGYEEEAVTTGPPPIPLADAATPLRAAGRFAGSMTKGLYQVGAAVTSSIDAAGNIVKAIVGAPLTDRDETITGALDRQADTSSQYVTGKDASGQYVGSPVSLSPEYRAEHPSASLMSDTVDSTGNFAGQMVMSGGSAAGFGVVAGLEKLTEGQRQYLKTNPDASPLEAYNSAMPAALAKGYLFGKMGDVTSGAVPEAAITAPLTRSAALANVARNLGVKTLADTGYMLESSKVEGSIDKAMGVNPEFNPDDISKAENVLPTAAQAFLFSLAHTGGAFQHANSLADANDYTTLLNAYTASRGSKVGTPAYEADAANVSGMLKQSGGLPKETVQQAVVKLRKATADNVINEAEPVAPKRIENVPIPNTGIGDPAVSVDDAIHAAAMEVSKPGPDTQKQVHDLGISTDEILPEPVIPPVQEVAASPETPQTPPQDFNLDRTDRIRARLEAMRVAKPEPVEEAIQAAQAEATRIDHSPEAALSPADVEKVDSPLTVPAPPPERSGGVVPEVPPETDNWNDPSSLPRKTSGAMQKFLALDDLFDPSDNSGLAAQTKENILNMIELNGDWMSPIDALRIHDPVGDGAVLVANHSGGDFKASTISSVKKKLADREGAIAEGEERIKVWAGEGKTPSERFHQSQRENQAEIDRLRKALDDLNKNTTYTRPTVLTDIPLPQLSPMAQKAKAMGNKSASDIRGVPVENNASGQTDVSTEAVNELKSRQAQGIKTVIVDSRSGKERPAIGIRPEDNTIGQFDVMQRQYPDGRTEVLQQGAKARPLSDMATRAKNLGKTPAQIGEELRARQATWDKANNRADKMDNRAAKTAQAKFENAEIDVHEFNRLLDEAEKGTKQNDSQPRETEVAKANNPDKKGGDIHGKTEGQAGTEGQGRDERLLNNEGAAPVAPENTPATTRPSATKKKPSGPRNILSDIRDQGVLVTGKREFGKTPAKTKGKAVGTSDLMDGFTATESVQPDMFSQKPAAPTDSPRVERITGVINSLDSLANNAEASTIDKLVSKEIYDDLKQYDNHLAYKLMKKAEDGIPAILALNSGKKSNKDIIYEGQAKEFKTALNEAVNLLRAKDADNVKFAEQNQPEPSLTASAKQETPQTGKPITIEYIRNPESSQKQGKEYGKQFGADIEPAGRYLSEKNPVADVLPGWETGKVDFNNPLVVDFGGGYREDSNWKRVLSEKYGGKTGKALSKSIVKDGHDGIITLDDKGNTAEIIDLSPNKSSNDGTKLYSGIDPTEIINSISGLAKNLQEDIPKLVELGKQAFHDGAETYKDFASRMKGWLKDKWDTFKDKMTAIYFKVKKMLKDERGLVGEDINVNDSVSLHNSYLDKAEAALESGNEEEVLKWLTKADEIVSQHETKAPEVETTPVAKPSDNETAPTEDQRQTSIKNAVTEEESGPQERVPFTHESLIQMGKDKLANDPLFDPRQKAIDIMNNPNGAVSMAEVAAMAVDRMKIHNEYEAMRELRIKATAENDRPAMAQSRLDMAVLEDALAANSQAMTFAGTAWSGIGHIRQAFINEDYSAVWLVNRAQAVSGERDLPEELRKELEASATKIAQLEKSLQDAIKRAAEAEAQKAVERIKLDEGRAPLAQRRAKRSASKVDNKREFMALGERLRSVLSPYKLNFGFDPEAIAILTDMAKLRISDGITGAKAIVDDIYDELQGNYAIEKRDIQDALSGYGKTMEMSQDEINVTLREVKRQLKLFSALEDAEGGKSPEKSGLKRDPQSDEVRRLREEVRQAMKASGIDNKSAVDPETQWKTSLDAVKTRLKNDIADLDRQIATKKRDPVKKTGIKYDAEALKLKEIRDAKKEALDLIDIKPGVSAQRRVEITLNSLERSIEEYKRQIATGDFKRKAPIESPETPAIKKLRDERDGLQKIRDEKLALQREMEKKSVPDEDPNITALNKFMAETEQKIKANEKALDKSIEEYKRRIAENDLHIEKKVSSTPEIPGTARKKAVLQALKDAYNQMQKDATPPKEPKTQDELDAIHLKAYKTRLLKRETDYAERLRTGDFSRSAKRTLPLDTEAEKLKARIDEQKELVAYRMRQLDKANRGTLEKGLDRLALLHRCMILSGTKVLWKISATTAILRPFVTTLEESAGTLLRMIPGIKEIAAGAPREGHGLSVRAEAAAYSNWFKSAMYKNVWDRLRQGKCDIDIVYGKKTNKYNLSKWGDTKEEHAEYVLETPGRMHGALKAVAYTQEFDRSLQLRFEHAIRQGQDISDPVWQLATKTAAEADAQGAQSMRDMTVVSAYKAAIQVLRQKGNGGLLAATGIKLVMPIVKIPMNIIGETVSYLPGGGFLKAGVTLSNAYRKAGKITEAEKVLGETLFRKAVSIMTADEKDYFMRAMKKQTVGLLVGMVLGWVFYKSFGGFYEKGHRHKPGELKPEEINIDDITLSGTWFHQGLFLQMQAIAMTRHLMEMKADAEDKKFEKAANKGKEYEKEDVNLLTGALPASAALAEQMPFVSAPLRAYTALQSYQGSRDYAANLLSSILIPQGFKELAKHGDTYDGVIVPRKTNGIADTVQSGIPGLRENLQIDMKKVHRMPLDDLAVIMESAPDGVKFQLSDEFIDKFSKSKDLDIKDINRYSDIIKGLYHR